MMDMFTFKTSVTDNKDLNSIRTVFNLLFGEKNWLFGFEDKVLRVFTSIPCADVVKYLLGERGFVCEEDVLQLTTH